MSDWRLGVLGDVFVGDADRRVGAGLQERAFGRFVDQDADVCLAGLGQKLGGLIDGRNVFVGVDDRRQQIV